MLDGMYLLLTVVVTPVIYAVLHVVQGVDTLLKSRVSGTVMQWMYCR